MPEMPDVMVPTSYDSAHTILENAACWADGNHRGCNRIDLLEKSSEEFTSENTNNQLAIQGMEVSIDDYDAQLVLQGLRSRRRGLSSILPPTCQNCPIKKWESGRLLSWEERYQNGR